jgi:predicted dehydrogenase
MGPTGVDLATEAVLTFDDGDADIRAGIDDPPGQWLRITGDAGEIELRDSAYTAWVEDRTALLVSDGTTTQRRTFPAVDAYRLMVEDVSSVIGGGPGWLVPLEHSRATAEVLDACFASARADGEPVPVRETAP